MNYELIPPSRSPFFEVVTAPLSGRVETGVGKNEISSRKKIFFLPQRNLFLYGRKFISSRKKIFFLPHAEKIPPVCREIFIRMKFYFHPYETLFSTVFP